MRLDAYLHPQPRGGIGSGVIIDAEGTVLTNNHVVQSGRPTVTLVDGRRLDGQVIGKDPTTDLAVIELDGTSLPTARLGDSSALEIGEQVVAIGNALGLPGGPTVTSGVVSATDRIIQGPGGATLYDLIQTDAAINPGNSGGPLVNLYGEVVGINTAIIASAQGIGFAIAINSARPIVESLLCLGRVVRPWIGVMPTSVTPMVAAQFRLSRDRGALILHVDPYSPAARAGLRPGDVIVSLDNTPVNDEATLRREIASRSIGTSIQLGTIRGTRQRTVTVPLEELPTT